MRRLCALSLGAPAACATRHETRARSLHRLDVRPRRHGPLSLRPARARRARLSRPPVEQPDARALLKLQDSFQSSVFSFQIETFCFLLKTENRKLKTVFAPDM